MLSERRAHTTLPVTDLAAAKAFWQDRLGFRPLIENEAAILFSAGHGSAFAVTRSSGRASGTHTQLGFTVTDIEAEVADLTARGVTFEEYDVPGLRTEHSVAVTGAGRAAWFRDPEGNLIGLIELA
jgi:catechol 2,3-dioxygenase-like lactoylglutathione lyase family enzyme